MMHIHMMWENLVSTHPNEYFRIISRARCGHVGVYREDTNTIYIWRNN